MKEDNNPTTQTPLRLYQEYLTSDIGVRIVEDLLQSSSQEEN